MSTQRNQRTRQISRNTILAFLVANAIVLLAVIAGVKRLETVLYERCMERQVLDEATENWRQVLVAEARLTAKVESHNPFIDQAMRDSRVASQMRIVEAGEAATEAAVTAPCSRLRLLGFGD